MLDTNLEFDNLMSICFLLNDRMPNTEYRIRNTEYRIPKTIVEAGGRLTVKRLSKVGFN